MTLKETVDQRRVVELPLNGRNPSNSHFGVLPLV